MFAAFVAGAGVGLLGGVIGLGGVEFRLPLLIGVFGFVALQAVIVNKTMSLAVVLTALPARLVAVPYAALVAQWSVAVNLLVGSLVGAWVGASWATGMLTATLHKVLCRADGADGRGPGALPTSTGPRPASACTGPSESSSGSRSGSAWSPPSWASPASY